MDRLRHLVDIGQMFGTLLLGIRLQVGRGPVVSGGDDVTGNAVFFFFFRDFCFVYKSGANKKPNNLVVVI